MRLIDTKAKGAKQVIGDYATDQEMWVGFVNAMAKRFVFVKGPINMPFLEAKGFKIEQSPLSKVEPKSAPREEDLTPKPVKAVLSKDKEKEEKKTTSTIASRRNARK